MSSLWISAFSNVMIRNNEEQCFYIQKKCNCCAQTNVVEKLQSMFASLLLYRASHIHTFNCIGDLTLINSSINNSIPTPSFYCALQLHHIIISISIIIYIIVWIQKVYTNREVRALRILQCWCHKFTKYFTLMNNYEY